MGNRPYINGSCIWLSTVAFCQLFEDIEVRNYDQRYGTNFDRRLKVDVVLDMKERIQHKLLAGGHKEMEQADTRLPRISIQITNILPDITRYSGKNMKRKLQRTDTGGSFDYQPFPINIEYSVSIWAKYFEHYAQILENIIPWFDPYMIVGVKERNFNVERELKVNLASVGQSSTFELDGSSQRLIRGDMSFTVESYAYKTQEDLSSDIIFKSNAVIVDITTPISSETISISANPGDILS